MKADRMHEDWIDTLQQGSFELPLQDFILTHGRSGKFRGNGRVIWNARTGIRLFSVTDCIAAAGGSFPSKLTPGHLPPDEYYVVLSGKTVDGRRVSAKSTRWHDSDPFADSHQIPWEQQYSGLTIELRKEGPAHGPRVLRALLGPALHEWPRTSVTTTENPFFGSTRERRGSLTLEKTGWNLAARGRTDEWFEIRILLPDGRLGERTQQTLTVAKDAFGFLIGRNLFVRGYEEMSPAGSTLFIEGVDPKPTESSLLPALDGIACVGHIEDLLGKLLNFFHTDRGLAAAEHLWVCRGATDTSLNRRRAIASICLEGLLRVAAARSEITDPGYTPEDIVVTRRWLAENAGALSDRFVKRLDGFVGSLGHQRPADILRAWQREGTIGVCEDDISIWKGTRNASAHARRAPAADDDKGYQESVTQLFHLENLINRVVLYLVGYRGKFRDYAERGWPVKEFPPTRS